MDPRMQHVFVNKPFYKSFRRCTECKKRNIFTRIAKCSGCKRYCHRRCVLLENNTCCGLRLVEPTSQVKDPESVVARSDEDERELKIVLRPEEGDRDLCPAESDVVVDDPDSHTVVSFTESFNSIERRPCAPDEGDLGAGLQDVNAVAIGDELMPNVGQNEKDAKPADDVGSTTLVKEDVLVDDDTSTPSDDRMPADDVCRTPLVKEEVQADEAPSTPSDVRMPADESSTTLANVEEHAKPIQGCSALELTPYRLSCTTEAEMTEDQIGDVGAEKNECCCDGDEKNTQGDDGDRKDVPGEIKLDLALV